MKKHSSGRSGLLLLELIFSILFFSLISAVCLQLFVKAGLLGRETEELDMAVRCAVSVAELLDGAEEPLQSVTALFPESCVLTEEGITLLFDAEFHSCSSKDMVYQMDIILSPEDEQTTSWSVILYKEHHSREIYRLEGTSYNPLVPPDTARRKGGAAA
ncbi:MAG: hypothetical protein HFI16_07105 [Lachnospiraceae bacterium]|nr:hypothetical protein [Lachnospiraceae bacterium]